MRSVVLLSVSTALAGALLSGCGNGGMFGKSSTATPSTAATQQQQQPQQQASADVRQSQQQLQQLGYYNGPVDGLWGPETQSAVERYQRERGLSSSGRIDQQTRDSLSQTAASGTTGRDRMAAASSGSDRNLSTPGTATPGTSSTGGSTAGMSEQGTARTQGEYIGGQQVGQSNTGQGATGASEERRLQEISPSAGPGAGARAISPRNLSQEGVREVQQKLADKGQYQAQVDGVWGPQSQTALVNFQTQEGLRADGMIGPQTANALGIDLQLLSANTGTSGMRGGGTSPGGGTTSPGGPGSTSPGMSPGGSSPGSTNGGSTSPGSPGTSPGGTQR